MKHHYVPVFYQNHFTADDGLLWVYDRLLRTCKQLHPRSICFQHDLYTLTNENGERVQTVETGFLRNMDGTSAAILRELPEALIAPRLKHQGLIGAVLFIAALQYLRVPANKQIVMASHEMAATEAMKTVFGNVERTKALLQKYAEDRGRKFPGSPESLVMAFQNGSIKMKATDAAFTSNIVKEIETSASYQRGFVQVGIVLALASGPSQKRCKHDDGTTCQGRNMLYEIGCQCCSVQKRTKLIVWHGVLAFRDGPR